MGPLGPATWPSSHPLAPSSADLLGKNARNVDAVGAGAGARMQCHCFLEARGEEGLRVGSPVSEEVQQPLRSHPPHSAAERACTESLKQTTWSSTTHSTLMDWPYESSPR